jgi:hypothetical protein
MCAFMGENPDLAGGHADVSAPMRRSSTLLGFADGRYRVPPM